MSILRVYCRDGSIEYSRDIMIDSSVSSRYPDSILVEISSCDDLSYIHESSIDCKPIAIIHGVYTAWVKGIVSLKSGKIDKLVLETTPFYKDGQVIEFVSGKLQQSQLIVPANGGNSHGVIKRIEYNFLGGDNVSNVYIFFEDCGVRSFILDTRVGGNGLTVSNSYAYNGSFQQHNTTLSTPTSLYTLGTYPLSQSLSDTVSEPRNIIYSFFSPTPVTDLFLNRLSSSSQGIATPFHTSGFPIAFTGSFNGARYMSHTVKLGTLQAPSTIFIYSDFIGFYPLKFMRVLSNPSGMGTGNVSYRRTLNKVYAHSNGGKYSVSGEVFFSPYSSTSLYVVGTPNNLSPLPKSFYRLRVETLSAYRMTCERLP